MLAAYIIQQTCCVHDSADRFGTIICMHAHLMNREWRNCCREPQLASVELHPAILCLHTRCLSISFPTSTNSRFMSFALTHVVVDHD